MLDRRILRGWRGQLREHRCAQRCQPRSCLRLRTRQCEYRSGLPILTCDLRHVAEGLQITIRKSKTDQESGGQTIAVPHGRHIKPVQALCEWLEAAGITEGPVFRPVARSGRVRSVALSDQSVGDIVKKYAGLARARC